MAPGSRKLGGAHPDQYGLGGCAVGCWGWAPVVVLGRGSPTGWFQFLPVCCFGGAQVSASAPSLSQHCAPTEPLQGPVAPVGSVSCFPLSLPSLRHGVSGAGTQGKMVCTPVSAVGRCSSTGTRLPWAGASMGR